MLADVRRRQGNPVADWLRMAAAVTAAGFRRYSTYRQATVGAAVTVTVFGFLKCYLILAVAGPAGTVAGYRGDQLVAFIWIGQGLFGVVAMWGWSELSDRVRTGDVAADLLRPVNPLWTYACTDLGRIGHALAMRLLVPVVVGALTFHLYAPRLWATYPAFLVSAVLGGMVSFALRYLVNLSSFWLLDIRGVMTAWVLCSSLFSGLTMPIGFFPAWARAVLWLTPFPAIMQVPLDTALERHVGWPAAGMIGLQVAWVVALLAICWLVQRRAVRRLVVQGG